MQHFGNNGVIVLNGAIDEVASQRNRNEMREERRRLAVEAGWHEGDGQVALDSECDPEAGECYLTDGAGVGRSNWMALLRRLSQAELPTNVLSELLDAHRLPGRSFVVAAYRAEIPFF